MHNSCTYKLTYLKEGTGSYRGPKRKWAGPGIKAAATILGMGL